MSSNPDVPLSTIPDCPELDSREAWQGLWRFSERLADVVTSLPPSSPVLVTGDWGSGKTTLLHALAENLKDGHRVVWFDAWRYESEDALLPALMRWSDG